MPYMTSSDITTVLLFIVGIAAILILVGLRLSNKQEQRPQVVYVDQQWWEPCEKCNASSVPTALYRYRDNPFQIDILCTYCALCSDVEPFTVEHANAQSGACSECGDFIQATLVCQWDNDAGHVQGRLCRVCARAHDAVPMLEDC